MFARIHSADIFGIDGRVVDVEVDIFPNRSKNASQFQISGLAGRGIRESRERIKSAIRNSDLACPKDHILVNLAPAAWEKQTLAFDLPIALAMMCAAHPKIVHERAPLAALGELSLNGGVRAVHGVLSMVDALRSAGHRRLLVPQENLEEAQAVPGVQCFPVENLAGALALISCPQTFDAAEIAASKSSIDQQAKREEWVPAPAGAVNFDSVVGHEQNKEALAIAVAGHHNVLMVGPPGSGKSLLARCIPGLLQQPSQEERLEITRIHSAAGIKKERGLITARPFRAPHHTVSWAGLVGGGTTPRPGEITAAHCGVLFLDELPEYPRRCLEAMREPLEEGHISICRSESTVKFPAHFLLVAAMNPCPCGYYGETRRRCRCSSERVQQYLAKVSGPLLDRIDVRLWIRAVSTEKMFHGDGKSIASLHYQQRIAQTQQFAQQQGRSEVTSSLQWHRRKQWAKLTPSAARLFESAAGELQLTTRGLTRVLRLARTLADWEQQPEIDNRHIFRALELRSPGGAQGLFQSLGG